MLTHLIHEPLPVQIHVFFAVMCIVLVPMVLWRKKRDHIHRWTGRAMALSLAVTALSSFWISGIKLIGPFSPIHALSVFTLYSLFMAIRAILRRDVKRHESEMRGLVTYGLGIAGMFAFLPGRLMNQIVFGETWAVFGFCIVAASLAGICVWRSNVRRRAIQQV